MSKKQKNTLIRLFTPQGESMRGQPWNVYPRPQLRRESFFCLNGEWELYASEDAKMEKIIVPFAPESALSGIERSMGDSPRYRYEKTFSLPDGFINKRVILHFGAVDQIARVSLNGAFLGEHRGGYESFSFDITDVLKDENRLVVDVADELENKLLPYGKQTLSRGGMWYTPVSGIWQTVWIESVPESYISRLDIDAGADFVKISASVADGIVTIGDISVPLVDGKARINIPEPHLWSPEDPYLYDFTVTSGKDKVRSYFALRTLEIKDVGGLPRLCLNGKPYFFHGLLDQGYYPDGILTPASPDCYEQDILAMKNLGFNMLRKHIKVEPEQFYYDCDRLGMVVFQDMVNNGDYKFLRDTALPTVGFKRKNDKRMHKDAKTRQAFIEGMESTVRQLRNHPSICYWTIFNEGWGQFDGQSAYEMLKNLDSSRFIDTTSGWFFGADSDVLSHHVYFKPIKLKKSSKPIVVSEFGGYSYRPDGHIFNPDNTYGYGSYREQSEFEDALVKLYENEVIPAVAKGLCAAVYTQVSDVEDETNGLLSYDRKVTKVGAKRMLKISAALYGEIEKIN